MSGLILNKVKMKIFADAYNRKLFYSYMADAFAMKDVRKELPCLCDESGRVWFVAIVGKKVIGFASIQEHKNKFIFKNSYVYPQYRNQGVHQKLVDCRLEYIKGMNKPVLTTARHIISKNFLNRGFTVCKVVRNYTYLRMESC